MQDTPPKSHGNVAGFVYQGWHAAGSSAALGAAGRGEVQSSTQKTPSREQNHAGRGARLGGTAKTAPRGGVRVFPGRCGWSPGGIAVARMVFPPALPPSHRRPPCRAPACPLACYIAGESSLTQLAHMHVQYDRLLGAFVPHNDDASEESVRVCAKLNEELDFVRRWLDLKRHSGRFATGFVLELTHHAAFSGYDVYPILDEIGHLERPNSLPTMTKRARPMRPPLRGLWHKHHYQARFFVKNLIEETERMAKDGRWARMFAPQSLTRIASAIPGH